MASFLLLLILYLSLSPLHLLDIVATRSLLLQNSCSALFTSQLSHGELASAFVCGTSIRDPFAYQTFVQTGLIHLMVVSGSHLQILSQLISWMTPKHWKSHRLNLAIALLLVFYALLTGFQPPVVRALVSRLLIVVSHLLRWGWGSNKINLASGLLLLSISPLWIFNFSFFLSWLACLGLMAAPLCFPQTCRHRSRVHTLLFAARQFWLSCFCVQVLMSVAFSSFSLLSLMMNSVVAPVISFLLFPLSISVVLIPFLRGFIDTLWETLLHFLDFFAATVSPTVSTFPTAENWIYLWVFLAFIHAFFEFLQQFRYRGSSV